MPFKIKEHREEKGLTITQMAEIIGVSRVYLSQIENGKVDNIGTKLLLSIAKCLDKKVEDILFLP